MSNIFSSGLSLGKGILPPVVERELRAGGRRPLFYWLRGLLALVLGFQAYELLDRSAILPAATAAWAAGAPSARVLPGADTLHHMAWLLFLVVLLMALVSADSLNRERREGTLGLLLLTDLTPREIVLGKMVSCGLTSFAVLLGALPPLMIPVLAGGVTGTEAAVTAVGLVNSLFVALAAGLWMAAVFRERRYATLATIGLVTALAFGPEILGGSYFGRAAAPVFRLFGLAGWMTAARSATLGVPLFLGWLLLTQFVGWLLLRQAAVGLAATWQDQPSGQFRDTDASEEGHEPAVASRWETTGSPSRHPPPVSEFPETDPAAEVPRRISWLTDPRPWDRDPVRWRVERLGSPEGLIWLAVGVSFFAQFGTLGSMFKGAGPPDLWGLLSFTGMLVIAAAGGLVAWASGRFFQDSRRHQDLELLLTSPLGARNILSGQWEVLRGALKWPITTLLVLALPAGISLLYDLFNGSTNEPWSLLQAFLIAVNLALELVALCWAGMWFGLHGRNLITSVAAAVGLVQLAPLLAAAGLIWAWLPIWALLGGFSRSAIPSVVVALLFSVAKNVALIVWLRQRLRSELRLGRRKAAY